MGLFIYNSGVLYYLKVVTVIAEVVWLQCYLVQTIHEATLSFIIAPGKSILDKKLKICSLESVVYILFKSHIVYFLTYYVIKNFGFCESPSDFYSQVLAALERDSA